MKLLTILEGLLTVLLSWVDSVVIREASVTYLFRYFTRTKNNILSQSEVFWVLMQPYVVTCVLSPFFRETTIYRTITLKFEDLSSISDTTNLHIYGLLQQTILRFSTFDDLDLESLVPCKSQA